MQKGKSNTKKKCVFFFLVLLSIMFIFSLIACLRHTTSTYYVVRMNNQAGYVIEEVKKYISVNGNEVLHDRE